MQETSGIKGEAGGNGESTMQILPPLSKIEASEASKSTGLISVGGKK